MADTKDLTTDKPESSRRYRFGWTALALWAIAIAFVPVDVVFTEGRPLTFTRDLLTIATVSASVATVLWYLDHNLVRHLITWRVGIEYSYRAGYRDRGNELAGRHNSSGEHTADVFIIEPMRHAEDRRIPEMRRNGHRVN